MRACLQAWFGPERFYLHYPAEQAGGPPVRHALGPGTCVHGHFNAHRGFGVTDYYPQERQWIAFLRDPFEQHLSLFYYLKKHEGLYAFAGRSVPASAWTGVEGFFDYLAANRDVLQTTPANTFLAHLPVDLETGDPARELARFIHVGTTEDLAGSLRLLARKLGFEVAAVPHLNAAEREGPIGADLRRRHERLFPVEHRVYAIAVERHRREFAG